ncbi:MAG: TIGR00282 family metallophosphoesterase [Hydrogenibacillus sp.]|nr:TIGR00282 family metallophosphoesterase [Hydrogenibacillus sp.]
MRVLFIGDIVGRPGRTMLERHLPSLIAELQPHFVVANGENAAHGRGMTRNIAERFFALGVDVITMGNHTWDNREIFELIVDEPRLLRPLNYPPGTVGSGLTIAEKDGLRLGVVNVMGRSFLPPLDDPFRTLDQALQVFGETGVRHILVDVHAEATAEKQALGWYLDGRASAVVGTHTHVQTADARILPNGTAYITDVGMTGPMNGVLGMDREGVLARFLTQLPHRFEVLNDGPRELSYVFVDLDDDGRATCIRRGRLVEDAAAEGTFVPAQDAGDDASVS